MDLYFFYPEQYQALYNCTSYKIDDIPMNRRQHMVMGVSFIVIFCVFQVLYIPCNFVLWKHRDLACYKIMLLIGIADVLNLWAAAFLTGFYAITGAVFCSYPLFNYVVGCFATVLWGIETCSSVLLALNRCFGLYKPHINNILFNGNRTCLWLLVIVIYSFYYGLFHKPALYNGIYVAWMFNPHYGYIDDVNGSYENVYEAAHDAFIFVSICTLYIAFSALLLFDNSKLIAPFSCKTTLSKFATKKRSSQKMIFLQAFLISSTNALNAALYFAIALVSISDNALYIVTYVWCAAHGK
ncbi:serpentine type 7TM GPCR chemoreceptor srt domain-containing protein [Ditylenchus destructor]|uniref:Serpentine type 7TM GPCR chemoreceptor srt domain-containing protein n=1 Tax=Ditylenchus destructor TaxID=166010 RepID=A0AAD4R1U1_9BILA|nr:serpentine type 7TM GPCR chemoreceptor srt domain-containing protein [Ditylenchus destructor]